jgi:hypothetical protein
VGPGRELFALPGTHAGLLTVPALHGPAGHDRHPRLSPDLRCTHGCVFHLCCRMRWTSAAAVPPLSHPCSTRDIRLASCWLQTAATGARNWQPEPGTAPRAGQHARRAPAAPAPPRHLRREARAQHRRSGPTVGRDRYRPAARVRAPLPARAGDPPQPAVHITPGGGAACWPGPPPRRVWRTGSPGGPRRRGRLAVPRNRDHRWWARAARQVHWPGCWPGWSLDSPGTAVGGPRCPVDRGPPEYARDVQLVLQDPFVS